MKKVKALLLLIGTNLSQSGYKLKNFLAAEFCKYSHNLKETWKPQAFFGNSENDDRDINSLKIIGISTTDPMDITTKFNNYFTGIAYSIAKNIPNSTTFDQYM